MQTISQGQQRALNGNELSRFADSLEDKTNLLKRGYSF